MATNTKHIVIEALQLGPTATRPNRPVVWVYRVLTPPSDWATAVTEWERLDNLRRTPHSKGLNGYNTQTRYFMVRSNDDPTYDELPRPRVFKAPKDPYNSVSAKGADERAARAFAKIDPQGAVRGNKGGWLYREGQRHPIGQGWDIYVKQVKDRKAIACLHGTDDWVIVPEYQSLAERASI